MDISLQMINWWAVVSATLFSFLLGGLWYSPLLFGKSWQKANGLSDEAIKNANMSKIFGGSFVLSFISALNLALFIGPSADATFGLIAGLLAGIGWVSTSLGVLYLFERKPLILFLINAGYLILCFAFNGLILGSWK